MQAGRQTDRQTDRRRLKNVFFTVSGMSVSSTCLHIKVLQRTKWGSKIGNGSDAKCCSALTDNSKLARFDKRKKDNVTKRTGCARVENAALVATKLWLTSLVHQNFGREKSFSWKLFFSAKVVSLCLSTIYWYQIRGRIHNTLFFSSAQ